MKNTRFLILSVWIFFQSCCFTCPDDDYEYDTSSYDPVSLSRTELDTSIQLKSTKTIVNSGKIYVINDLLFVGEELEGFHIFDNSDPQNPAKIKFLQILGVTDIAIRDNTLYANQGTDLVTLQLDLANESVQVTKRVANTFPELISPDGYYPQDLPEDSVITNWKLKN